MVLTTRSRREVVFSSSRMKQNFSLSQGRPLILTCTAPTSCQELQRTATFLNLSYFILFLFLLLFLLTIILIVIDARGTVIKIGTGRRGLGNKRMSEEHLNYCIIEIGQNTGKSPGDLRRFPVTQTSVKDHQLTLRGKLLRSKHNYNNKER